ncbi:MAG: alanine:cation symporter family protein [Ruminococcaceae bacterium]|nr:alanine:cation symporter family protein [Oscillospiraceae bacterium]
MEIILSAVPFLLLGTGFFYIFKLRGFYLLHPFKTFRKLFVHPKGSGSSSWRALAMALAGTLGVGNIVGVATALYLGGAGSIFWMIFSALIAMVLKYAEICLAMRHRRYRSNGEPIGGAPYYICGILKSRGLPQMGRIMGGVFALLCLVNTFTMGSMLQSNAAASAMREGFGLQPWLTGSILALLTLIVSLGGARRIASVTEKIVPLMTVGFLGLCLWVLILRYDRILPSVYNIFHSAFSLGSMGGGIIGFITSQGFRYGIMRGLVSNEAGCGTAPMAHATSSSNSPATQGIFGLVEVFVDTILLCSITALAILVSDIEITSLGNDGVRIAKEAFASVLGPWAGTFFSVAVLSFGVATILCWCHYGATSLYVLTGKNPFRARIGAMIFSVLFSFSVLLGALSTPDGVWVWADIALGSMTILNLAILLLAHKEVMLESERLWE